MATRSIGCAAIALIAVLAVSLPAGAERALKKDAAPRRTAKSAGKPKSSVGAGREVKKTTFQQVARKAKEAGAGRGTRR